MALSDELEKLQSLRERGVLSDDEFARAKERLLDTGPPPIAAAERLNALRRSREDRWLAGVCGGLADATGVESWLWRLAFTLLLFAGGAGAVVYALFWIFVPVE
jgi:phage shock protein C